MPSIFRRLKFAWDYFVRGRHRLPQIAVPPDFDYRTPDETLMNFAEGMFVSHGAQAFRRGSWIVVDGGRLFVRAAHFDHCQHPNNLVLQADFVCVTSEGQHIIESFAGIGDDVRSALMDACKGFQDSSFHALFVTLLDRPCDHVERETWCIAGIQRAMTFGWLRTRGKLDFGLWPPVFEAIQQQVEVFPMPPGLHWVRYFYAHIPNGNPTIEVLVDNQLSDVLISQASRLPWPASDSFYSVRLFFTIQDAPEQVARCKQSPAHPND